jgi:hypothetical protein
VKKWLKVGAVAMFIAWLPFLYAELTSEEAEGKDRALPAVDGDAPQVEAVPIAEESENEAEPEEPEEPAAAEPAAAAPPSEQAQGAPGAAQPKAPGEPGATAQEPAAAPSAAAEQAEGEGEGEGEDEEEGEEEPEAPTASGPVNVLRQAFEKQPRDALWAGDTEHKLRSLFGTADVPAELLSDAACRSSVCRVDVKWTPQHATAYVGIYEASTRLSGAELGIEPVGEADEHGAQRVQLYVTRQGYTMADLAR